MSLVCHGAWRIRRYLLVSVLLVLLMLSIAGVLWSDTGLRGVALHVGSREVDDDVSNALSRVRGLLGEDGGPDVDANSEAEVEEEAAWEQQVAEELQRNSASSGTFLGVQRPGVGLEPVEQEDIEDSSSSGAVDVQSQGAALSERVADPDPKPAPSNLQAVRTSPLHATSALSSELPLMSTDAQKRVNEAGAHEHAAAASVASAPRSRPSPSAKDLRLLMRLAGRAAFHVPDTALRRDAEAIVAAVHERCFDPATLEDADSTLGDFSRPYRTARSMNEGDPDLLVYQNVHVAERCKAVTSDDVVLVSHLTIDRSEQLIMLASRWQGCLSVAVMTCSADDVRQIARLRRDNADLARFVSFHVVIGPPGPYPFNVMRNVAMEPWQRAFNKRAPLQWRLLTTVGWYRAQQHATVCEWPSRTRRTAQLPPTSDATPWMFTVDIDAMPSVDASTFASVMTHAVSSQTNWNPYTTLFIVHAFEGHHGDPSLFNALLKMPGASTHLTPNREWLRSHVSAGKVDFFHSYFSRAYIGKLPLGKWLKGARSTPVQVQYIVQFEPYFIAKVPMPRWDEGYRGRGYSKSSWFFAHVANGEYDLALLPEVFVFARTDFDTHHTATGKPLDSNRRENAFRIYRTIVDYLRYGMVCRPYLRERMVQMAIATTYRLPVPRAAAG